MRYAAELDSGQQLVAENDGGGSTFVTLSNSCEHQQQSQRIGFETGRWSSAPTLFRLGKDYILRVNTVSGARFIIVRGNRVQSMKGAPDLQDAEEVRMRETNIPEMASMEPMKPMEPIEPLEPLKPMEMQMGNMRMSMSVNKGAAEPARRFCTQCGKPVGREDRFCAYCGAKIPNAT
ncbi:zinc ribbon domain-containing protein [Verrucomicrobiota bacterium sgz303538]